MAPWWLCAPIAVWMLHFLTVYVVAAIRCARSEAVFAPLAGARSAILLATAAALMALAALAGFAMRRRRGTPPQSPARAQDDFLATLLLWLCGLSAAAAPAVAAVAIVFGDCRQ